MKSYLYKIFNYCDNGEQSLFIESFMSEDEMKEAYKYVELNACKILEDEHSIEANSVSNFAIAAVLIAHYNCDHCTARDYAIDIERISLSTGIGEIEDADTNYPRAVPDDKNALLNTIRLFANHVKGYPAENNHYDFNEESTDTTSDLPPSGFTFTHPDLHAAAKEIITRARNNFGEEKVSAHLTSYRHCDYEHLSCDLFVPNKKNLVMPITIAAINESDFQYWDEPQVVDMTEAIHLSGLIISALNAEVSVGRHKNEINECLLATPLQKGETSGIINLT